MTETIKSIRRHYSKTATNYQKVRESGITDICVIGLGYIGLPTATLLADRGFQVLGVDINQSVVDSVNAGKLHIVEPELDVFLDSSVKSGKLRASTNPQCADVFLICVPTPINEGKDTIPEPDLSLVQDAAKKIAPLVKSGNIVILESTSPVGATEMVADVIKQKGINPEKVHIAYCPERVLPGKIVKELFENDRIVGGINEIATRRVAEFYRSFIVGDVLESDCRTAEMCKLVENASRDVQIAFANELSLICDKLKINVRKLIELANRHPRVNILNPGTGVGGHCLAVDPWFIVSQNPEESNLIRKARDVNKYKTQWVIEKIHNASKDFHSREGRPPVLGMLGLAFKPDIDDLRESPAVEVVSELVKRNEHVLVCEPHIMTHPRFTLVSLEDIEKRADLLIILVDHRLFRDREFNIPMLNFVN